MDGSLCTTIITSGGSNPPKSTISYQTTTTYGSIASPTLEFKILAEISPKVFILSGDFQVTNVPLEKLETSLAGTVLLVEYDSDFRRLFTWFWHYGLSRDTFNSIYLAGDYPDIKNSGRGYLLAGCSPEIRLHKTVLERKWSGRLFSREYAKKPLISVLLQYLAQDIQKRLLAWTNAIFTLPTTFLAAMRQYCARFLQPRKKPDQDFENGIQHSTQIPYTKDILLRVMENQRGVGVDKKFEFGIEQTSVEWKMLQSKREQEQQKLPRVNRAVRVR